LKRPPPQSLNASTPTITFYFTNFLLNWDSMTMLEVFKRYGPALNVYIPGKRNIQGKRFGLGCQIFKNPTTRPSNQLVWLRIFGLPSQLWWEDSFSSLVGHYGDDLIPEDCCTRQFNLTFGKVAKFKGDTNTIFNGYVLASSSNEEEIEFCVIEGFSIK
ncbi:hypothetical protein Tco_1279451, partial [Tanacetum coccineum]